MIKYLYKIITYIKNNINWICVKSKWAWSKNRKYITQEIAFKEIMRIKNALISQLIFYHLTSKI